MKKLFIDGDVVRDLPSDEGSYAPIIECRARQEFDAWCDGPDMAGRYQGQVYVKVPQSLNEDGEFSLDYYCLPIDEANACINRWNTAQVP